MTEIDKIIDDLTFKNLGGRYISNDNIKALKNKMNKLFETQQQDKNNVSLHNVSNCLHENQVMRQGDGDVYHQCLDCCELLE